MKMGLTIAKAASHDGTVHSCTPLLNILAAIDEISHVRLLPECDNCGISRMCHTVCWEPVIGLDKVLDVLYKRVVRDLSHEHVFLVSSVNLTRPKERSLTEVWWNSCFSK